MRGPDALQIRNQIDLSQFAGFPVYFFDFGFLLANVPTIATWSREKLESVIGARADNMLGRADVRLPSQGGFHIIFSGREANLARERANAVCTDILKHFSAPTVSSRKARAAFAASPTSRRLPTRWAQKCQRNLNQPPHADAADAPGKPASSHHESLVADMNTLFRRHFGKKKASLENSSSRRSGTAPMSASPRSSACQPARPSGGRGTNANEKGECCLSAGVHCITDLAALAFALKGIWQLISRGDIALVTVPVHIETLSWSKHRTAYLNENHRPYRSPPDGPARFSHLWSRRRLQPFASEPGRERAPPSCAPHLRAPAERQRRFLTHAGIIGVTGLGVSAPIHPGAVGRRAARRIAGGGQPG